MWVGGVCQHEASSYRKGCSARSRSRRTLSHLLDRAAADAFLKGGEVHAIAKDRIPGPGTNIAFEDQAAILSVGLL